MKNSLVKISQVLLASALIVLASCDKEKEPSVSTTEASEISFGTATIGGNVTSDGGAQILARGIVWGTNSNPTLSNSFTTDQSNSTGTFSHTIEGLVDGTTYYARAYATNSVGTAYGNEVTFSTVQKCLVTSLDIVAEDPDYGQDSYSVNFTYDNSKKLTSYSISFGKEVMRVEFKYNTSEKIDKVEFYYDGYMEEYLKFTWNDNNVDRQWYYNEGYGWESSSFFERITFTTDGLIDRIDEYFIEGKADPFHVGYSLYQWQNQNVSLIEYYYNSDWAKNQTKKSKVSIFNPKKRKSVKANGSFEPNSKGFTKEMTMAYTNDNKINPFSFHQALGLSAGEILFLSANNVLSETVNIISWQMNWTTDYTYQYNTTDYPTQLFLDDEDYTETWGYNYDCN